MGVQRRAAAVQSGGWAVTRQHGVRILGWALVVLSAAALPTLVAPALAVPHGAAQSPLVAHWLQNQPLVPGRAQVLQLRILWQSPLVGPLRMALTWPPGVRVIQGPRQALLQRPKSGTRDVKWLVVSDAAQPADLVAELDWQTAGAGVNAKVVQRFGRAAPQAVDPPRRASSPLPNGLPLHRAIPVLAAQPHP